MTQVSLIGRAVIEKNTVRTATPRMTDPMELELIASLKSDRVDDAVSKLYQVHFEAVVTSIVHKGGTRDDGIDIFQDALVILIDKVKGNAFRGESSIKTFLFSIAQYRWMHEMRTRSRRRKREMEYSDHQEFIEPQTMPGKGTSLEQTVSSLLGQIGDICKKILIGYYYEDKSIREILADTDYDNEQVLRNRKSKCMKKLKELIQSNPILLNELKNETIYE